MGGCAKFLSVLTLALGFIGFFVVGGWLLEFNCLLISIPLVALAAAYALNAPDDFFQDHPMLVVAIAATSGLLGLGLKAVPFTLDTKTSSDTEPRLALPVVAVFVVAWSLAALFLADAVALFVRLGGAAEPPLARAWEKPPASSGGQHY